MPKEKQQHINTAIVFFPKAERNITQDGYILAVVGKKIQLEFNEMGGDRTTDNYDWNVDEFPAQTKDGIWAWEGEVGDIDCEWDTRPLRGTWRPATADDLLRAGLIQ